MIRLIAILGLLAIGGARIEANVFVLRATSDCCHSDSNFEKGSRFYLLSGESIVGSQELDRAGPFRLSDVKAGKYDIVVCVTGYYPTKYVDVPIGEDGQFDYELAAGLMPTDAFVLEGQISIRFRRDVDHSVIKSALASKHLNLQRRSPDLTGRASEEQYFETYADYTLVNASFDRNRDVGELIREMVLMPEVIACYPISLSGNN
jgi:hypothetical protein